MTTTSLPSYLSSRLEAPARPERPRFAFEFERDYGGLYAPGEKLVLRQEHWSALSGIAKRYNRARPPRTPAIGVSDLVTAALDFLLEHAVELGGVEDPEEVKHAVAKAIYRKAFLKFTAFYAQF